MQGTRLRGIFSFLGKRISPFDPQEKGIRLAVWSSNNLYASGMKMPARGKAALALRYDLPLLLLSAVAQPLAALTPYGCGTPLAGDALPILQKCAVIPVYRGAHQCGERSNATFRRQSAAKQTSLAPHDSKARLRVVTTRRRFMAKPCTPHLHCAARAALRDRDCQCKTPFFWTGDARFLSRERKWGAHSCSACGAAFPAPAGRVPPFEGYKKGGISSRYPLLSS